MANLSLDYVPEAPFLSKECYYCEEPILESHVIIHFEGRVTMRLHVEKCWNTFVGGIAMLNETILAKQSFGVN